jgi:hypothetical protein
MGMHNTTACARQAEGRNSFRQPEPPPPSAVAAIAILASAKLFRLSDQMASTSGARRIFNCLKVHQHSCTCGAA